MPIPRYDIPNPDQPFEAYQAKGGTRHGGGVITAASEMALEAPLEADAELTFQEGLRRSYRPQNFQSLEGPRLYQSNNTGVMNVVLATQQAMGFEMVKLRQDVLTQLTAEMQNSLAMPIDLGIRAVGTYCDFGAEVPQRTAEPSLVLGLGPKWENREPEVFALAAKMAKALSQQSVAVFVPCEGGEAFHLQVNIANGLRPTPGAMDDIVSEIQEAYTLHLDEVGRVKALDVIGTMIEVGQLIEAIEGIDAHCLVSMEVGSAYLITGTGEKITI